MKHYLYSSAGNTEGLDEYIAYFEIAEDGYCARYLEIRPEGHALKYTEEKPADAFGALPEGRWDAVEAAKPRYGTLKEISNALFDSVWDDIRAAW
ncbi:hypothetical protein ACFQ09_07880 [Massilia norwichensis]|uniref:Uncharacterized protein n=1 Tax=Massilia norwichensis TaxID=1442366 RepID=A0ABT2AC32_9BURK|nr:hypothetical protein [Massilia norwichensis]MCS0591756.1 hypothetical protein [Massilia norwichensis]